MLPAQEILVMMTWPNVISKTSWGNLSA